MESNMKYIALITALLLCMGAFISCGKEEAKKEDAKAEEEIAEDTTQALEDDGNEVWKAPFETIAVEGYVFMNEGEQSHASEKAEGADRYASSKPDVATVNEAGEIEAKKAGVTLIAYEKDGEEKAYVLCVFAEDDGPDRSAGSPMVFETGKSFNLTAAINATEYFSSNEAIADASNAPIIEFKESGYAVITASNASRPFFYSFLVYDREITE